MKPAWLLAQLLPLAVAFLATRIQALQQCPSSEWMSHNHWCYKWFTNPTYWFVAEQTCLSHRGHLVSIGSRMENRLVGFVSNCSDVWIGRYGTNLNRLSDPSTYSWTDATNATQFQRHNFSQLNSVHKPLIRTDGEWWFNSLYHEAYPFVCKTSANRSSSMQSTCPDGWSQFNNHCYILSNIESNFNEANFYCQRKSSQLVSVMSESELRFINTLDVESNQCAKSQSRVWIGLIKLNPCFPDSGGRELCYQWTDFSGKHGQFPAWESGHPNSQDWTVNCVTLSGDKLQSDRCYNRHRFVCKSVVGSNNSTTPSPPVVPNNSTTPSPPVIPNNSTTPYPPVVPNNSTTPSPPVIPDGMLAAFDFRKGLQNLINPATYRVYDEVGVPRNSENGACFSWPKTHYRIGEQTLWNQSILTERQWTMFYSARYSNMSGKGYYNDHYSIAVGLYVPYNASRQYCNLLIYPETLGDYFDSGMTVSVRNPDSTRTQTKFHVNITMSNWEHEWTHFAVTVTDMRPEITVNYDTFSPYQAWHGNNYAVSDWQNLFFGHIPASFSKWSPHLHRSEMCARCFGIARKALSKQELRNVFANYCN